MEPIRVPPDLFAFAGTGRSDLYVSVLHAFSEANDRLETALSRDDVRARLRAVGWLDALPDDELARALDQLRAWKLVDVTQNHSENYRTAEEYERRNLHYSLSRAGEAAFAGVTHALGVLASTGALQTAVLDAISDKLGALVLHAEAGEDRQVFIALTELEGHLEALRVNTTQFNGELQRLLRSDSGEAADLSTFHEVKASTVAYLQEFVTNLDRRSRGIAERMVAAEQHGLTALRHRALVGADLPRLVGPDPGPAWLERRRVRWEGLRAWFLPEDGSAPRVEQLHLVARRAIVTLLQVLDRITESRRRASSAVADFRELARWFSVVPGQEDLHVVWSTMFGLSPSRHAHLAHPDPELVSSTTSWAQAPPVEVSPLLRAAGRTERFSRTGRVRDVDAIRAARAEDAKVERALLEVAWSHLDTGGPTRLSAFGRLDHAVFERLLELLGRALAGLPDRAGVRRSTTSDGRVEIVLRPLSDGSTALVVTPSGRFAGPDYEVEIAAFGARPARRAGGRR